MAARNRLSICYAKRSYMRQGTCYYKAGLVSLALPTYICIQNIARILFKIAVKPFSPRKVHPKFRVEFWNSAFYSRSLHGAMVKPFKFVCEHNPSYFQFIK